jgi:hypothetical protein
MKTLLLLSLFSFSSSASAAGPKYHLLKKAVLGGEGGWDLLEVDSAARRVYLTRGGKVQVVDADSLKPVGEIPGVDKAHGVAVAPGAGRGFATAGGLDEVVVFDLKTLKTFDPVKTGGRPPRGFFRLTANPRTPRFSTPPTERSSGRSP